jgi:hypothetical protein
MSNFSEYLITADCEIDPATADDNIDRKGCRKAMLIADGYRRVITPRNGVDSDSPKDGIAWTKRIGTKSLNDPKHVNNTDYAAVVASEGRARLKVWW